MADGACARPTGQQAYRATAATPEELANTAWASIVKEIDNGPFGFEAEELIAAAIRQHSLTADVRATQGEALCAEAVRAARLLHSADGDCDPQFGKALAWLSEIAIGNNFTELERRSPAGPLEDATHARERAEGALQAVKQALEEIQMIASGAIGPNCGAGPDLIRIAGQADAALDTIRRLASVPPVMNSDAVVGD